MNKTWSEAEKQFIKEKADIAKADADYGKVENESRTLLGAKPLHWSLSSNKKLAEGKN